MKNIITEGKDKSKKEFSNNVVYRIHCNNCPATYVGQTKRKLMTRINEHITSEVSATTKQQRFNDAFQRRNGT